MEATLVRPFAPVNPCLAVFVLAGCAAETGELANNGRDPFGQQTISPPVIARLVPLDLGSTISVTKPLVCALREGESYCFGASDFHRMGNSSQLTQYELLRIDGLPDGVLQVESNSSATCVLDAMGVRHCWGLNGGHGALGCCEGELTSTPDPIEMADGPYRALSAGSGFTCGLDESGAIHCWGSNQKGQLATDRLPDSFTPRTIEDLGVATDLSASRYRACALVEDGRVACWGAPESDPDVTADNELYPGIRSLDSLPDFVALDVGPEDGCGITAGSRACCWGVHLGSGSDLPLRCSDVGLSQVAYVSVGYRHACAVRHDDDGVYCWGVNEWGQLGAGHTDPVDGPVRVAQLAEVTGLVAAQDKTCAWDGDGQFKCWGTYIRTPDEYVGLPVEDFYDIFSSPRVIPFAE